MILDLATAYRDVFEEGREEGWVEGQSRLRDQGGGDMVRQLPVLNARSLWMLFGYRMDKFNAFANDQLSVGEKILSLPFLLHFTFFFFVKMLVSSIRNKIKREEVYNEQRAEKNRQKLNKRLKEKKLEASNPELKEERLKNNVPKTLENTREMDETIVEEDDEVNNACWKYRLLLLL